MLGWYIDEIIGYIIRTIIRRFKAQQSTGWPIQMGTISRSTVDYGIGGHVAEVTYTYTYDGEYYGGTHWKPFFFGSSGKDYVERFEPGSDISVRVNPGNREVSFVHDDDQTSRRRF